VIIAIDAEFLADFLQFKEEYEREFGDLSQLSTTEGASLPSAKKPKKLKKVKDVVEPSNTEPTRATLKPKKAEED